MARPRRSRHLPRADTDALPPLPPPALRVPAVSQELRTEWLQALDQLDQRVRELDSARAALWAAAADAREAGVPWDLIGVACGLTKQGAHQRFTNPPPGRLI